MNDLDSLQEKFFRTLRIFMKTAGGSLAPSLVADYALMKNCRSKFQGNLKKETVSIARTFNYEVLKDKSRAYRVIEYLGRKLESMTEQIFSFVIHGSFATEDFIPGWSDLDTMIILKDEAFSSADFLQETKNKFLKLSLLCYQVDPLAHHQLSFLTEFDLSYYPQSFLPLVVFSNALRVSGLEELTFILRDDEAERLGQVTGFRDHFVGRVSQNHFSTNKHDWKNDLAIAMLAPSLLLQSKSVFVYKKESFAQAKELFPLIDFSYLDRATQIMRSWKVGPNLAGLLPPWLIYHLPYQLSSKIIAGLRWWNTQAAPAESPKEIKYLTSKFAKLYREIYDAVIR